MAFHINNYVEWKAGAGSPTKYSFTLDADVDVVNFEDNIATISVAGTATIVNHPTNSRNSFAASDFAILVPGNIDISAHPFVHGTSYYEASLPFLPDPQNGDKDKMLIEFRGDTWISDPVDNSNKVSLWANGYGVLANQINQESTNQYNVSFTFDIPINTSGNTTILAWDSSGCDNSTTYDWMDRRVWASWFDLTWDASLTYDANGGSGAPNAQSAIVPDSQTSTTFTIPNTTPTWGLYEFLGWSTTQYHDSRTEADVEYHPGDTITVLQSSPNVTLYAVWRMDYRPGATLDTNTSIWKSHNRTNGACHVLSNVSNITWQECRTIGGEVDAQGNPPLILHAANANSWYNQKRIGKP